ncbi:anti-sigma factor family protein [Rhizobium alvei]|uniref:Anti-sigma factor n=1 Tax=Rhizobium alvei TaxID=1132659 RepID=A0ABT8YLZ6_9HYPH|nr:hypothetical protein [Rhizobium alvei]MDO6964267.1 hypothetical protein [Rhizobium alvei]
MDEFESLPLEVRLSAYLDGQVEPHQREVLEALLASDEAARQLLETLKAGSEFGNNAFEEMLRNPVPLSLVRAIKEPKAAAPTHPSASGIESPAKDTNVVSFFRYIPQAIAASAVLLLAGGYSGYFVGKNAGEQPSVISETTGIVAEAPEGETKTRGFTFDAAPVAPEPAQSASDLADKVIATHEIFARQKDRLVEFKAGDEKALTNWLRRATNVEFVVPDLTAEGLVFQGARLISLEGKPTGGLFYKSQDGAVTAIYFVKGSVDNVSRVAGKEGILAGTKNNTAWFVVSPKPLAELTPIAEKTIGAL